LAQVYVFLKFKNRTILISKAQIKLITNLQQKKYRNKENLFVAEGPKIIADLLKSGLTIKSLFSVIDASWLHENYTSISLKELQKVSFLKTPNTMVALFHFPKQGDMCSNGLTLVVDAVRDPGNLGTMIRLAHWFAVDQIICSKDTVDCFNPKVIQATMGSVATVPIYYIDIKKYLEQAEHPVYAAVMNGESVYEKTFPKNAFLVMGNEANGISKEILELTTHKITIPNFGGAIAAESLNVATATGILLNEFRRVSVDKD